MNPITRLKCAVRDIMRRRDAGPTPAGRQVRPNARKRREFVYWPGLR